MCWLACVAVGCAIDFFVCAHVCLCVLGGEINRGFEGQPLQYCIKRSYYFL